MDALVLALGPAFAAGFAVQQLLELLAPIADLIPKKWKKIVLGLVSLGAGILLAYNTNIRVLEPLGVTDGNGIDRFVTALVVSAGTQGVNSIMKFLGYAKEAKKGDAEQRRTDSPIPESDLAPIDRV